MVRRRIKNTILLMFVFICLSMLITNEVYASENIENVYEEADYMLETCDVLVEEVISIENVYEVHFRIKNNGDLDISNWQIVYEANYDIISSLGVEVVMNDEVKSLKCLGEISEIKARESQVFILTVISNEPIIDSECIFRVYGRCQSTSINNEAIQEHEVLDIITYNTETQESMLTIVDGDDIENNNAEKCSHPQLPSLLTITKDTLSDEYNGTLKEVLETRAVIGEDGRRIVSSVTTAPYYAIAYLRVKYPNGKSSNATGFMISDHYMLTAAHVLYDGAKGGMATSVEAYFGVYGGNYQKKYIPVEWTYCSSYPSNAVTSNDWGCIRFSANVGSITGTFGVAYATDNALNNMMLTVTGFPGDKSESVSSGGIYGYKRYMYKSTSYPTDLGINTITHMADTFSGESGAPIYRHTTNVVYAIHCAGDDPEDDATPHNYGRRISQTLYNSFNNWGWLD